MLNKIEPVYYAWSPDGTCSDPFDNIDEAEDVAYYGGYRYVVKGQPSESIDIVIDMSEEDAMETEVKDLCDLLSDL